MDKKKRYRELCEFEASIPLFSQAWWLDCVCGPEQWDVCVVIKGEEIVASMPYSISKRLGFTLLHQPKLTQTLGPWLKEQYLKNGKKLSREKELLQQLVMQLPKAASFISNWQYNYTNWLPLYWLGFSQTTRYTYVINDLTNLDAVWNGIQGNIKGDIKKAVNRYELIVHSDLDFNRFFELNKLTFLRQSMEPPYSKKMVDSLIKSALEHNQAKWFIAQDNSGNNHAGVLIVWDSNSAYYLMGGGDPQLRNSGATSLCMWEAIKFASTVTKRFDFEGSMIEPIEKFFRAFGATQTPYFRISKTNSKLLKIKNILKEIIR